LDESRVNNKWPFAKEGIPFILAGCALIVIFSVFGFVIIPILASIITIFIIFFFRDPDRKSVSNPNAVLTPADGKILEIKHLKDVNNPLGQEALKVSIFMSVLSVHVNRIPIAATVKEVTYTPGRFFSANLDKASKYNENNRIILKTLDSRHIALVQIAGLIARRIACWIREDDVVDKGQRFGLIRFGSRVEVFLPADSQITVGLNQKVSAGKTIIGYLS
jgi:phosphatidylserine decarboxylase